MLFYGTGSNFLVNTCMSSLFSSLGSSEGKEKHLNTQGFAQILTFMLFSSSGCFIAASAYVDRLALLSVSVSDGSDIIDEVFSVSMSDDSDKVRNILALVL